MNGKAAGGADRITEATLANPRAERMVSVPDGSPANTATVPQARSTSVRRPAGRPSLGARRRFRPPGYATGARDLPNTMTASART